MQDGRGSGRFGSCQKFWRFRRFVSGGSGGSGGPGGSSGSCQVVQAISSDAITRAVKVRLTH